MKSFITKTTSLHVLKRGEELQDQLRSIALEAGLSSAWMNGIGGASRVTIGFYDPQTQEYQWRDYQEPLEIISLQGNLSIVDGEPFWHVHGVFGRRDYSTISGHVKACLIGLTGELHITPIDVSMTRMHDAETGLNLLTEVQD